MHHTEVENTGLRKLVKLKEREHTKIKRLASVRRPLSCTLLLMPRRTISRTHRTHTPCLLVPQPLLAVRL
jgi:hypothetical protein